eukprot:CAMPEP_0172508490 /NCGR_PEP_ID=MMETSP1066-20121228/212426_1 /TAXON_ID=671091 /ORGANISM="Coscinodiscus wailesii, Strain CCMP2513" /LENGTH=105 /DNA_ID=CAMNT_0013286489 /DNA_START=1 /DNA_END=315 /DNA_ORIENTATION=-
MQKEMSSFVKKELAARTWMRAMSPHDKTQPFIERPDHGTTGAYSAWPALALEALCRMGEWEFATELFHNFSVATLEGPFGQAHGIPQQQTPPYTPFDSEPVFKTT